MNEEEKLWLDNHIGKVELAPDSHFEPFEFFDSNNKYMGLGADYVHLIEGKLGFNFKYVKTSSWAVNIEMMKKQQLDVWGAVVKTPQRDEFMEFTLPYYELHSVLIIPSNYKGDYICNPDSGDMIAVVEGYYTHDYLKNNYLEENILHYSSVMEALQSVQNGQSAAFLTDIATASYYFEKSGIKNLRVGGMPDLGSSKISMAVRSDWKILAVIIDKVIERITPEENAEIIRKWVGIQNSEEMLFKIDNSTLIKSFSILFILLILLFLFFLISKNMRKVLINHFKIKIAVSLLLIFLILFFNFNPVFPNPVSSFHLTEEEQIWLDNNQGLKIAPDYSFAPIEFIQDNQFKGISADYVSVLEDLLDYKFEIVKIEKWSENIESAKNREIDIWSAVATTPQKSEYMLFTEPYLDILSVFVVSRENSGRYDINNMGRNVVAVVKGYFTHDYLKENFPDVSLRLVDTAAEGLQAVAFKEVNAMLIDVATASWLIEKNGLTTLKVGANADIKYQLSFASRSDMPILNQILNRALKSIPEDKTKKIYNKWINYSIQNYIDLKKLFIILVFFIFLVGLIFTVIIFWNKSLRKMVSLRVKELAEKDAQLLQAQKMEMVGTLAGGLAHDFNNIVTGISGTVALIKLHLDTDGSISKDQLKDYLLLIDKSGDRAVKLVQQLLTVSRKQKPSMSVVDLNELVQDVTSIVKSTLDKSIILNVKYLNRKAIIIADAGQIEQVLLNFCLNASHSMTIMRDSKKEWGGVLDISITGFVPEMNLPHSPEAVIGTRYWVVSVKDTGVGINKNDLKDIFTPFYTTKVAGTGTGLGLSMVYSIVSEHNGFVEVSSIPGEGSEFKLYIPGKKADK